MATRTTAYGHIAKMWSNVNMSYVLKRDVVFSQFLIRMPTLIVLGNQFAFRKKRATVKPLSSDFFNERLAKDIFYIDG